MSVTFTKLFSSITESTIWCEPDHVRITWITMLAMADRRGRVWASIPGLANRARVTIQQAEDSIRRFKLPDAYSRTPDNEGVRIADIDGGWVLLNHAKYRETRDEEARLAYKAEKQAEYRAKKKNVDSSGQKLTQVSTVDSGSHNADADADAEACVSTHTDSAGGLGISSNRMAFEKFYAAYPVKKRDRAAWREWLRLPFGLTLDEILSAVERQKKSDQWKRGVIPNPDTWLSAGQWNDEVKVTEGIQQKDSGVEYDFVERPDGAFEAVPKVGGAK
jgi:hypothetical protein